MNFKSLVLASGIAMMAFAAPAQTIQPDPADEQTIRTMIAAHAASSQKGDHDGLNAGYHADSDVRYTDGVLVTGRKEIGQRLHQILAHGPKAMAHEHPEKTIRIRFLRPDVAFVDVESVSGGGTDSAGAAVPVRRDPFFLVFTKVDGRWGVAVERMGARLK
jgi:uncharacterized protein (TIGR02246 family)